MYLGTLCYCGWVDQCNGARPYGLWISSRERSWSMTVRGTYVLRVYTRRCVRSEGERESKDIQESYMEIPPPK